MGKFIQFSGSTLTIGNFSMTFSVSGIVEILIFAVVSYYIILWIKRTKAWNLLKGVIVLAVVYGLAVLFNLDNIAFLFKNLFSSILIAVIVIFQPEIRRALESIGTKNILKGIFPVAQSGSASSGLTSESIDAIVRAMSLLGKNKVGALICIERTIAMDEYIETGIPLDAKITTALLEQVFVNKTPLHDGAVVIRDNRIVAATCYLPLSQNTEISKELGTRHRAGLGISEVTDCITLIASEETGALSVAENGGLKRSISAEDIRELLLNTRGSRENASGSGLKKLWKGRQKNEE